MKNKALLLSLCAVVLLFSSPPSHADIITIKADGVVNPVMSELISMSIDEAVSEKADALVIELDTPGGLDASMRTIVRDIIASEIPVIVYVSPSGARAASAGVFITLSAHVAAMAPGTNIGAAHPVGLGGKMDKTMLEKAENDAAAYIKSLAEKRGRNAEWAEKAVRESVSITEKEALKLNVIDISSPNLTSLLESIDNRTVELSIGKHTIKTKGIPVRQKEMGTRHKILNIISDPNIAYVLMMLGFYGLFFELTNPGAIFPGVFGVISLILAFYSFQTLPVNYAGLLLIILAIILFILEITILSHGLLTIGGIISMILGSLMLFESPQPFFQLSLKVILPAVFLTALFFSLSIWLSVKAYRRKPKTGVEGLIGITGTAKTDIHNEGLVFVHGEIWRAWSDVPIKAGEKVIVEKVEELKLKVRPKKKIQL
ncbi:MAG: nodulation protein NfeD [Thermodesulfovibrionia bacterium]|nr:nodulation protein NfeD [Thermodesulfovibrionia bacterium]